MAVIGYGLAGATFHAPVIAATPGLRLATIVTSNVDAERAAAARARYEGVAIVSAVEDLWAHADRYDLVVVAAHNRAHVPLGLAAIEAGLPVVIDKPVAPASECAERLGAAARAAHVPVVPSTIVRGQPRSRRSRPAPARARVSRGLREAWDGPPGVAAAGRHATPRRGVRRGAPGTPAWTTRCPTRSGSTRQTSRPRFGDTSLEIETVDRALVRRFAADVPVRAVRAPVRARRDRRASTRCRRPLYRLADRRPAQERRGRAAAGRRGRLDRHHRPVGVRRRGLPRWRRLVEGGPRCTR